MSGSSTYAMRRYGRPNRRQKRGANRSKSVARHWSSRWMGNFALFVLSAAARLDNRALKRYFSAKNTRFASPDELMTLTGLVPGSVPPFGRPVLPLPLYVDPSIFENQRIAFNAGSLRDSLVIATSDYRFVAQPGVFRFHKPQQ